MAKGKQKAAARICVRKTYKLYIGGKFPRTESGRYFQATNKKGDFVANVCRASRKDFRNAVVAARGAQDGWAGRTAFNRGQILYRMAEMMESRRAGLQAELVNVAGLKANAAAAELDAAIDRLVWYAGWSDKFAQVFGSINPVSAPFFNFTVPEPTGVVAVFAPRHAPLLGLVSAIAPVIVSGNTAVVIVDNDAPTVAIELAEILATSDLPGGVVNILTGQREELLSWASGHMDVDAISCFGASADERKSIEIDAAESVKRVKMFDDPRGTKWAGDDMQSPYWILPFVEFKTAWHPIGR